jgi:cell division septation protein DedD
MMAESTRNRLIGFGVITMLLIAVVPFLVTYKKPDWLAAEDKQTFKIPKPPQEISLAASQPKKKWIAKVADVQIKIDPETPKIVLQTQNVFKKERADIAVALNSQSSAEPHPIPEAQLPASKIEVAQSDKKMPPVVSSKPLPSKPAARSRGKKATSDTFYSIRLATFSKDSLANKMKQQLRQLGYKAYTKSFPVNNKPDQKYTVVYVGKVENKADVQKIQPKLNQQFKIKSIIVKQHKKGKNTTSNKK